MPNKLLSFLYLLVATLLFATCIREIDFSRDDTDRSALVVSGSINDGEGPFILQLSHPADYDKRNFAPVYGASITLSDDLGNQYAYVETDTGRYLLSGVHGEPGRTYTLDIRLPDGTMYRSRPEKMPQRVPIDSVEVRGEFFTSTNADGTIVKEPFAYLYAHATAPAQTGDRFLRWDAEAAYIFVELPKIYRPIPPPQLQCYFINQLSNYLVPLADLTGYQPGAAVVTQVGKRRIDKAFEHRIGFLVRQSAISREAYEYWQKIGQLVTPTGTIFDTPPARVFGNVENRTNPDQPALGYFEVAAVDSARVFTKNGQLGDAFLLQDVPYCNYDWNNWPPVNHPECDNCLLLEGGSLQKPAWWD